MQDVPLTGRQIRAARGALNWSVQELADRTGVGTATIVRYEVAEGVPKSRKGNLAAIRRALEAAGIEFIGAPDDRPGLRIGVPPRQP
ncbi:helix-turn-helix domain-containing protein [Rhodovulum marinum]|uniref:Helix-turn-helix protein n=1 Tax=Rhodovulum marinum TaxID=320662 RepID=A0A4R2PYY7_9RHOB|nr:helix-turn-helix transcriptional regulator [Rhodovulum marinum]TCP41259.1 helix-turn-helix protein [Rhodovulum marinum]